jgi:hypothetical protein
MKVRPSMRKSVGAAVSVAALLALLPLGASGAMADDVANDGYVDMGSSHTSSITLNASAKSYLEGHTFKLLRIGTYEKASQNAHGQLTGVVVGTVDNVKAETETAYKNATHEATLPSEYEDNPVGAVATKMLGFSVTDSEGLTDNQDETSSKPTYEGKLRDFAQELAGDNKGTLNAKFAGDPLTGTMTSADTGATTVRFDGLEQGLYIVKDVTNPASLNGSQLAIPMVVGTAVGADDLNSFANDNGMKLGVVNMKDDVISINKTMAEQSLSAGMWGHFTITTKVPLTTGFSKGDYVFKVTDTPSYGFTLPQSTDADHYYKIKVGNKQLSPTDVSRILVQSTQSTSASTNSSIVFDFSSEFFDNKSDFAYGDTITITYALRNSGKQRGVQNSASLDYSTVPGCKKADNTDKDCPTAHVAPAEVVKPKTYSFKLGNMLRNKGTMLSGSTFTVTLVKDAAGTDVNIPVKFVAAGDNVYSQADEASASPLSTLTINDTTTESAKGIMELRDIDAGTYEIQQTGAASNPHLRAVMLPKFQVTLTPNADDGSKVDIAVGQDSWHLAEKAAASTTSYNVLVNNVPSVMQLPLTGGAGIILAVIVVLVLAVLLGVTVALKRRHEAGARRIDA